MNIKKNIIAKYRKKINLVNKYNKYYYDNNNPIVDDKTFDNLKKICLQMLFVGQAPPITTVAPNCRTVWHFQC